MNLNQLKIFYAAVKYASMTQAAKALCISQPAVSKGLQRFQDYYEIKLVEKRGKRLIPTEAGERLYIYAKQIFDLERVAEENLKYHADKSKTAISIHTSETFAAYFIPSIIKEFHKSHPDVRISVEIAHNRQVLENTINHVNDLGIVSNLPKHHKVTLLASLDDFMVIIMRPDHRLAANTTLIPSDLQGEALIMHEQGSAPHSIMSAYLNDNGIKVTVPVELSNNHAIKYAVLDGLGIALVSKISVDLEVSKGILTALPIDGDSIRRTFQIIKHRDGFLSDPAHQLVALIQNIWNK